MKSIKYVNRKEVADKVIKKVISSKKARFGVAGVIGVNTAIDSFAKFGFVVGVLTMSGLTAGLMTPIGLAVVLTGLGIATIGFGIYKIKDSLSKMAGTKEKQIIHAQQLEKIAALQAAISAQELKLKGTEVGETKEEITKPVVKQNLKSRLKSKANWLKTKIVDPILNVKNWVIYQIKRPIYLILEVLAHADKISLAKLSLVSLFFAVTGMTAVIGIATLVAIFAVFVALKLANEACKYMVETYNTTIKADIQKAENTIKDLTKDHQIVSLKTQLRSTKQTGSKKLTTPLFDLHASKQVAVKKHVKLNKACKPQIKHVNPNRVSKSYRVAQAL